MKFGLYLDVRLVRRSIESDHDPKDRLYWGYKLPTIIPPQRTTSVIGIRFNDQIDVIRRYSDIGRKKLVPCGSSIDPTAAWGS